MTGDPLHTPSSTLPESDLAMDAPARGELDLFSFVVLLLRHLRFIAMCGLACFLFMVFAMLSAAPRFASTSVMIIPQGNLTASSLTEKLSLNTADLLGGGYELYADILNSRTILDRLIDRFDLLKVYKTTSLEAAENLLASRTKVQTSHEGVIRVTVQDTSPQRAADIANQYLAELDLLNSKLVLTSAAEERKFIEGEMRTEKDALADAEVSLKQVQETTSGVSPDAQASAGLSALETTRAQLRADQIRLSALLTGETDANPQVVRLRSSINAEQAQLNALQNGAASAELGVPTARVPAAALEYARRLREVKFHETLFGLLEREFESAKQEEAKHPNIVQVLDQAVPSRHKAWPPRVYYCLLAGAAGIVLGIMLVSLAAFAKAFAGVPRNRARLAEIKRLYGSWIGIKSRSTSGPSTPQR